MVVIGLIQANEIILGERLKARGNFDDNAEAISKRITTFNDNTRPVLDKFSKSVKKVGGKISN